jgi:hypothetical protein
MTPFTLNWVEQKAEEPTRAEKAAQIGEQCIERMRSGAHWKTVYIVARAAASEAIAHLAQEGGL